MEKSLFSCVFRNVVLNQLIFEKVNEVTRTIDHNSQRIYYSWNEIITRPYVLAAHGYSKEFKACLDVMRFELQRSHLSLFFGVIKGGNVEMMQHLLDHYKVDQLLKEELQSTANRKPSEVQMTLNDVMEHATKKGRMDIVNCLFERFTTAEFTSMHWDYRKMLSVAPLSGDLEVVKFFSRKVDEDPTARPEINTFNNCFNNAARIGRIDLIQWLAENRSSELTKSDMMKYAISGSHLDTVVYLWTKHKLLQRPRNDAYMRLIRFGNEKALEIFKLLNDNDYQYPPSLVEMVARSGNVEVMKLIDNESKKSDTRVRFEKTHMDVAAEHNHFGMMRWLHENRSEGCTTKAFDECAKRGYIDALKWLYVNRTERCSRNIVNEVASNGHIEVLLWLDSEEPMMATTTTTTHVVEQPQSDQYFQFDNNILDTVVKAGHLDVVKFMHERNNGKNNRFHFSEETMDCAAEKEDFNMMRWLQENRTEGCTYMSLLQCIYHLRLDMVEWVYEKYPKSLNIDGISEQLDRHLEYLFERDDRDILKWLIEHIQLPPDELLKYQTKMAKEFPKSTKSNTYLVDHIQETILSKSTKRKHEENENDDSCKPLTKSIKE
ncbi:hypothetical protein PPL_02742 [Heterostelium album PN500]|uniref:Ankyrin repeat-containing protein n=1 Tax=Heterostelium pallidum (strain ATCC 26659 / Pp 5 / PN500) TaxID=670386 RepID=D3B2X8_HETP5|nr:hypothetical protein PPL_02742 [Heterostelium album PN500]EFA83676.1 hypothetical protein PPL_02742 [Heterostelium album PN500]|eukprot:XP_020435793.1 hypothetical protein PPL_02742 [Heterostelium album PN500]